MNSKASARFWGFNPRMFWEGFRQLRTVGILALVILTLAAILMPVGIAISELTVEEPVYSVRLVSLLNMHPLLTLLMPLAPLMVLMLFQFLNQRKSGDFYHALPVSRAGLFFSLFAAVMAWVLLIAVVSTAASLITTLCFPMLFQITFSSILPFLTATLSGALLLAGCAAVAMCITGTLFTNVLVTGLLFFAPRFLMIYVSEILQNIIEIIPGQYNNPFLDLSYNIPYALVAWVFTGDSTVSVLLDNWSGCLYTAVMGFVLLLLANFLFRIRHSEAAGQSASTPLLQTVYRLLITFLVTLIPVAIIVDRLTSDFGFDPEDYFILLVLYLIAAVAFCVYELITTKKPRQLLKIAPSFLIVLAADAVLLLGIAGGYHSVLSFRPKASEIDAVSFSQQSYSARSYQENYFAARSKRIAIEDPKIAEIVSERLEAAARLNSPHGELRESVNDAFTFLTSIRTGGVTRQRILTFTKEQTSVILSTLEKIPEYQSTYTLPQKSGDVSVRHFQLTQEQINEVYRLMVQEINALPFETRYALLAEGDHDGFDIDSVFVTVNYRASFYNLSVPLTNTLTPKAYEKYLTYLFEEDDDRRDTVRSILQNLTQKQAEEKHLYIEVFDPVEQVTYGANFGGMSTRLFDNAIQTLDEGLSDRAPGMQETFCRITVEYPSEKDEYSWIAEDAYFTLSEQAKELLKSVNDGTIKEQVWIVD